jgi:hypothetical protein
MTMSQPSAKLSTKYLRSSPTIKLGGGPNVDIRPMHASSPNPLETRIGDLALVEIEQLLDSRD